MIGTAEALKTYAFAVGEGGQVIGEMGSAAASEDAGHELDRLAKDYAATFKVGYDVAFHQVLANPENRELKLAYAGVTEDTEVRMFGATPIGAGMEVDRLTREYIAQHGVDYSTAMNRVLADPANAQLKAEYGS